MNDIVISKIQSIQRCVARAREEFGADPQGFETNFSRQDAALLNVLRACEQAIDLANHMIKTRKMGIPASSADSFDLIRQKAVIDAALAESLKKMVGFRNAVVHQYQQMDLRIVKTVIAAGLDDLIRFGDRVMEFLDGPAS